jgi:hypothetical protein
MNLDNTSDEFLAETNAKHDAAIERRKAAEAKLRQAIEEMREATAGEIAMQAYVSALWDVKRCMDISNAKQRAVWWVINIAQQNRAQWSGGPHSPTNIIETMRREEALAWLGRR